ncbi:HlyD family efflux transporter periplasmic adaptor subunit [Phaeovulum sp.]|uniref:HlyD family efflux transporter periplasmic adaptor subunit n=1 Tax=Phaeovulum sp. TaxID=2934796 RepID=UPI0039E35AA8
MTTETPAPKRPRRLLMASLPLLLVVGGLALWLASGRYEETENAALHQARISVASDISGRVVSVAIAESQTVKAGDVLFQVDPEPYNLALAQADAALAQARLGVDQLRAAYNVALAQEKIAADEADFQASELMRQESLTGRGAATSAALDKARHASAKADEALSAARLSVVAARTAMGGVPEGETDSHPSVLAALVARDKAAYNLSLTTVLAPADGVIYQAASFKPGQFVGAGAALFSLVETGDTWIDANFKETQIAAIAPGQRAEVEFDLLPGRSFSATVEAIGAGTGAEFSLLPAQNATGNWVKVTQRVPVRLRLDEADAARDLRSGLSVTVKVDTGQASHLDGLLAYAGTGDI